MRQRTEKPFALEFVLRLTVALPELRFRFHALLPLEEDDQKLAFEERLLNVPVVLRLPASAEITAKLLTQFEKIAQSAGQLGQQNSLFFGFQTRGLLNLLRTLFGAFGNKRFWRLQVGGLHVINLIYGR